MLMVPLTIVATRTTSDDRPAEVDDDDHPAPVEAVRHGAAQDAESSVGQVLAQHRQRDEERVARLRGDEQRAGREDDAVADVVDDRGGQEPAEAPSEPRRDDGLDGRASRERTGGRIPTGTLVEGVQPRSLRSGP